MIKVNLLKDQTAQVRKTFAKPTVSRIGLIFCAIFLLAAAAMGTWGFYVHQQIQTSTDKVKKLRAEVARLQDLKKEIEKCMLCGKCQLVCPRGVNLRNLILSIHSALEKAGA